MRLSVLDQSIAVAGRPHDQSIRNTVALAQHCEALGYDRFWVSEHHNHPTIVGTAPEIVIAAIAATTQRIRIGSAGIMLPHYAPFKVAEVFRVLDALAPGRIDLGLGRAPGSDGRTAFALNPAANERPEHFPADVRDLIAWVHNEPLVDRHPFAAVQAYPQGATAPEVWILGSSDYGAQVAALFGLPYCYAWFFSDGAGGERAIELYKQQLPAERAPSRAAFGALRLGAGRPDDGRGAVPLHLARALAHASRPGNPGTARGARRRRRGAQGLRPGARRTVPQGLLRRHRPRGRGPHRGAADAGRRRRDGRRHLDLRRGGAARELHASSPRRRGLSAADGLEAPPQRGSVQLSEKASAEVLKGRPSRSRFHGLPRACWPLQVSRPLSAGTSTVQTP